MAPGNCLSRAAAAAAAASASSNSIRFDDGIAYVVRMVAYCRELIQRSHTTTEVEADD